MPGPDLSRRRVLALGGVAAAGLALPRRATATPLSELESEAAEGLHDTFTLSNATVVTGAGDVLSSAGVRVEGGLLVEQGPQVTGGVDLGGRWIVPGFTDAGCKVGLVEIGAEGATNDSSEGSDAVVPDARAWEAYNPLSEVVAVTRAYGITTVLVHPEPNRLVAGQAGLLHTVGRTPDDALLHAPAGLVVGLGGAGKGSGGPSSRMGVAMRLRALLSEVELPEDEPEDDKKRRRRKKADEAPPEDPDAEATPTERVWRQVLRGALPVLFKAERADDILAAIALTEEWGLRGVVLGGAEAWVVGSELEASGMGVLMGPLTAQPGSFEHLHARYDNAAMLQERGVPLGFRTGSAHFSRGLSTSAGVAVAHGLPWAAALHALTDGPAEVLGVPAARPMVAGQPATFFVSDGDPLQPRYPVRRVWVRGREQRMDHRQRRLLERFRTLW